MFGLPILLERRLARHAGADAFGARISQLPSCRPDAVAVLFSDPESRVNMGILPRSRNALLWSSYRSAHVVVALVVAVHVGNSGASWLLRATGRVLMFFVVFLGLEICQMTL